MSEKDINKIFTNSSSEKEKADNIKTKDINKILK
jgi:hypothetical protein